MLPDDIWDFFHPELHELTTISPPSTHCPRKMSQILSHLHTYSTHHSYNHNEYIHRPTTDIRETDAHYYFDIEMPGVTNRDGISIIWTSSRTLVVEGTISRPDISLQSPLRPPYNFKQNGGEICDDSIGPRSNGNGNTNGDRLWPPQKGELEEDIYDPLGLAPNADYNGSRPHQSKHSKAWTTDSTTLAEPYDLEQGGGEDEPVPQNKPSVPLKRVDKHEQGNGVHIVVGERVVGHFKRDFSFPVDVDREALRAVLAAGLLTIKTPKMVVADEFHQNVEIQVE